MEEIRRVVDERKVAVTSLLLAETISKACDVGLMKTEKSKVLIDKCLSGEYTITELTAISNTINALNGVERLNRISTESEDEKKRLTVLVELALELTKLNKLSVDENLVEELEKIDRKNWLEYIFRHK